MKFQIKFKSIDHSQTLCDYTQEKFTKLEKYEVKPVRINVTFSIVRHEKTVELFVQGMKSSFRAKANGEDFHEAINLAIDKLERQMEREKAKVKDHLQYERSHMARLDQALKAEKAEGEKDAA